MIRSFALCLLLWSAAGLGAPLAIQPGSELAFTVRQMGVPVDGRFTRFSGEVALDPAQPETATAALEVDILSLSTGDAEADATARDAPWLNATGFPKASFKSARVRALGGNRYEAQGPLTLRGKTRDVVIPFTLTADKSGAQVASGRFALNRSDYGVGGGEWNEGDLVANEVQLRFKLVLAPPRGS